MFVNLISNKIIIKLDHSFGERLGLLLLGYGKKQNYDLWDIILLFNNTTQHTILSYP